MKESEWKQSARILFYATIRQNAQKKVGFVLKLNNYVSIIPCMVIKLREWSRVFMGTKEV